MPNNKQQQQAIDATYLQDVLIAAGAGSGKTKTLSTKVFEMVKRGEIVPSELLILTFTNNAAHEMKERIIATFKGSPNEVKILSSHVQTFDSFSQYLVKSYSKELSLSDSISIANNDVIETKRNSILDEILNEYYLDPIKKEKLLKTLIKFNISDDSKTRAVILDLIKQLDKLIYKDRVDFINNYESKYLSKEYFMSLVKQYIEITKQKIILGLAEAFFLERYHDKIEVEDYDFLNNLFKEKSAFLTNYKMYSFENEILAQPLFEAYKELLSLDGEQFLNYLFNFKTKYSSEENNLFCKGSKKLIDGNSKFAWARMKEIINELPEARFFGESLDEEYRKILSFKDDISLMLEIVKELDKRLIDYKRISNCFTFSDISEKAYLLLIDEKYKDVAKEIRNKFKFIMVDEYQDTNDIQEGVINSLLETKDDGTRSHLFCVGDAKQSIYAFRNSKVELFRNRQASFASGEANQSVIAMNLNYRSGKQVLLDINEIFNKYMTLGHGGIDYIDESEQLKYDDSVDLYGKEPFDSGFGIYRLISSSGNHDGYNPKYWEVLAIINDIKTKTAPDSDFRVYDRSSNPHVRRAKYSDFAVLMRTKSGFDLYQKLFNEYGIPLNNKITTHLRDLDAILLIESLTNLISFEINNDKVNLKHLYASVARSYIYQNTDQEIFDVISQSELLIEDSPIMQDVISFVNKYSSSSFSDIFLHMLSDFHIIEKLNLVGNVDDNIAKIEQLYSILVAQEAAGEGLSEFVKLFKDISKFNLDLSADSSFVVEDAVDMMTIHASKGLERKIVYMPCSYNKFSKGNSLSAPDYKFSTKYGIILPYYNYSIDNVDEDGNPISIFYKTINNILLESDKDIQNPDIDEHVRLFYVALTRAENRLIIVGDGPDYFNKEEEQIKKKEDLYSMLSYLPHYLVLDDKYIDKKILEGVINASQVDKYNIFVNQIKTIKEGLKSSDFSNPLDFKNYTNIFDKYFYSNIISSSKKLLNEIRKSIFLYQVNCLNSMDKNSEDYLNIASKFFAISVYHEKIDNFDDLNKYLINYLNKETIEEQIYDLEEQEEVVNVDEDETAQEDEYKTVTITLPYSVNQDNLKSAIYSFVDEFIDSAINKKQSKIFGISESQANKNDISKLIKNFSSYLLYAFDNILSFARISFKCENYSDNYEEFDCDYFLSLPKNEKKKVDLVPFKCIDDNSIEFEEKVRLRASKRQIDDDLEHEALYSRGNYIHSLMELIDFKNIDTSFIKNKYDRKMIDEVLENDILKLARTADKIYQEYGYFDELYQTTGFIDLLFVKDGDYYIVDYKYKHITDDEYINQLHTYQRNVMNIFNLDKSKIRLFLISIKDNDVKEIEVE